VTRAELDAALADPIELTGTAGQQVTTLVAQIEQIAAAHPRAAAYRHGAVL
jgi:adenylosuccinate lyase